MVIIEYSDFECPFCATFVRSTLPELERTYIQNGQVSLAFKHFPLESIHQSAMAAATAAACANQQGRFWPMHKVLFDNPKQFADKQLVDYAVAAGADRKSFETCLAQGVPEGIRRDIAEGQGIGVSGTPMFFIGSRKGRDDVLVGSVLSGARPLAEFQRAINAELQKADGR